MTTVFVDRANKFAVVDSRQTTTKPRNNLIDFLFDSKIGKTVFMKNYKKGWFKYFVLTSFKKTNKIYLGYRVQKASHFQILFAGSVEDAEELYKELSLSYDNTWDILSKLKSKRLIFWMKEGNKEFLYSEAKIIEVDSRDSWFIYGSIRETFADKVFFKLNKEQRTEKVVCQVLRYASLFDKFSDNDYKIYRW